MAALQAFRRAGSERPHTNQLTPLASASLQEREDLASTCGLRRRTQRRLLDERLTELATSGLVEYPQSALYNSSSVPDKVFALAWLESEGGAGAALLMGTKDNQLLRLPIPTTTQRPAQRIISIPLPTRARPAPAPALVEAGVDSAGIHAIASSPRSSAIASGADDPRDIAVLDGEGLHATHLCIGHSDWIFSLAFVAEGVLASGSRDRTVKLWDCRHASGVDRTGIGGVATAAAATRRSHQARVRAMTYLNGVGRLATLSADGGLLAWDPLAGLQPAGSYTLPQESEELMCLTSEAGGGMAMHPRVLVAGGRSAIYVFDAAAGTSPVATLPVDDSGAGVRSLALRGHALVVGQADGYVTFIDVRHAAHLRRRLVSSAGFRRQGGDPASSPHRTGTVDIANAQAVFAVAWSRDGRLAAAGGPLLTGVAGCYAGVWQ